MNLLMIKCTAALLLFLVCYLAGKAQIIIHQQQKINYANFNEALSSGIFLGAALFNMLPDAETAFRAIPNSYYPYTTLCCTVGFIGLLVLEKISAYLSRKSSKLPNPRLVPYILTLALSIHALTEGMALGINTAFSSTLIIFIAIVVHKSSESFALAASLIKSQMPLKQVHRLVFAFSCITPLGIGIASLTTHLLTTQGSLIAQGVFTAFAAGTFIYIATIHQTTNPHQHSMSHLLRLAALLLGMAIMAALAAWV